MVTFEFFDKHRSSIGNIGASDVLPDEVARMEIRGPFDCHVSSYKCLTTMLQNSNKKLGKIEMTQFDEEEESPEFLAFLILICNRTNALELYQCFLSSNATTCLMSAVLANDGIRDLSIQSTGDKMMYTEQAKLLFRGITSSPCLQSLDLRIDFVDADEGRKLLIHALRQNKSLKKVSLFTTRLSANHPTFLPTIAKTMILGPNVESISIVDDGGDLQLDAMHNILCHPDCTLRKLQLEGVRISVGDGWHRSVIQNTSVRSLAFNFTDSSAENLKKIISIFSSLEELDISPNTIRSLSFLDPLLFGEKSQLKSFDMSHNCINQTEMESFIEKLRNIRGLKNLAVGDNHYEDSRDTINAALVNALRDNMDLEHVDFDRKDLPLDLNRGGRRIFESKKHFPRNLLPRVLERASKISYYKPLDRWGDPTNNEARADVVFWMIHRLAPDL